MDFPRKVHEPINSHEDVVKLLIFMTLNQTKQMFKKTQMTSILC